jgi:dsDNA-specific endonuclease/ATPase MutS2
MKKRIEVTITPDMLDEATNAIVKENKKLQREIAKLKRDNSEMKENREKVKRAMSNIDILYSDLKQDFGSWDY